MGKRDKESASEASLLIARLINSVSRDNLADAIRLRLSVSHNLEVQQIEPTGLNEFCIYVKAWQPVSGNGMGALEGVRVQLPVEGTVGIDNQGRIKAIQITNPSEEKDLNNTLKQDYIASGIFRAVRDYKEEMDAME